MKRSNALAPLSREHHQALHLALLLRRATDATATELSHRAAGFWIAESREHFEQEEQVLLPLLAAHAGAADPDIARVQHEHADLRRRFGALPAGPEDLVALGERLNDHVRFEERELFPRIEALLGDEELARVGELLSDA